MGTAVLVLDGHSRAAVEVVQSLGSRGISVDVAAESGRAMAFSSRYPRRRLVQPGDVASLAAWLGEPGRLDEYGLVVPTTEGSLQALLAVGESSAIWAKALLPAPESLAVALSKEKTWELARSVGVPAPGSRLIRSEDPLPSPQGFPCVLKPVHSVVATAQGLVRLEPVIVRDESARARQLARLLPLADLQEQEYVRGRGVGVECLYSHGRIVWHFVHERVHELPLSGGGSTYRRSMNPSPELLQSARALLDALEWHGVAMVEFKLAADGRHFLMEINPRLWGSLALAIDAGVDFPWGMWLISRGESPGPQPSYRVPYHTRFLPGDVDWMKENLRADRRDDLLLTRPVLASALEYLRPLLGRESWDHFRWTDPGIVLRQIGQVVSENVGNAWRLLRKRRLARALRRQHARALDGLSPSATAAPRLLFVCYGNICRSPFAARYAARTLPAARITSSGFHDQDGRGSPSHLLEAAAMMDVDLANHRSTRLTEAMMAEADLVLVMDLANFESVLSKFPHASGKVVAVGLFAAEPTLEIEDPYQLSLEGTLRVLRSIASGIDGLATRLGQASGVRIS